ncbi:MAG TPA: hypothetical protein GXZ48_02470 [Acholeplasmataceae bacterium]|nr:hypothetical protein [Acholeplasmataceae bacterium]
MNINNEFGDKFIKALDNVKHTSLIESMVINDDWIEHIKNSLQFVNNIIKNPRTSIKEDRDLVPVERARRFTPESVRHLASNTRYIKDMNEEGEIRPTKILTSSNIVETETYENRFIKSLIDKLLVFLERRYKTIKALSKSNFVNIFQTSSSINFENLDIDFALRLNVYKQIDFEKSKKEIDIKLNKISELVKYVNGFIKSPFYQGLKEIDNVTSPIMITNIIRKEPNYHRCYMLWVYLDKHYQLDYKIERYSLQHKIDKNKLKEIFIKTFYSFYTDEIDYENLVKLDTKRLETKKIKIAPDFESKVSKSSIQEHLINEYFFQESRKVYERRIRELVDEGEPFHIAFESVYRCAFSITEQIFDEFMEIPERIKNNPTAILRFKIRNQSAIEEIYKLKIQDLNKMQRKQIKLIREIEKEKLKIEKQKLQKEIKKKSVLSKAEKALEKERLNKIIENAKAKLEAERQKTVLKLREVKEIEKQKAKLKLQNEREKAKEKIKLEKEKAKALLKIKRESEKAKYEARIAKEKSSLHDKVKKEKAKIWTKAEKEIMKIRKQAEQEIASIQEKLMTEIKKIESNPDQYFEGDKE